MILLGNNGYLNFLLLVLNINSFDDEYLTCVIPKSVYKYLDLYLRKETKVKKPRIISMIENLENLKKKGRESSQATPLGRNHLENEEDIQSNKDDSDKEDGYYIVQEDLDPNKSAKGSLGFEIMVFFNFMCVYLLFIFLYLIPLKDILTNEIKFNTGKVVEFYRQFMVYFGHMITITFAYYFLKKYFEDFISTFIINDKLIEEALRSVREKAEQDKAGKNHPEQQASDSKEKEYKKPNFVAKIFLYCSTILILLKMFFVFLFLIFYYLATTKGFYKTLNIDHKSDIKLSVLERHFPSAFGFSESLFNMLKITNNYDILSEYQSKYARYELELKIKNGEENKDRYEYITKRFGVSDTNNLQFFNFYFSRLDYQLYKSALSDNINKELYAVILCGKILERNPIVLDLLKYKTREETNIISN